MSDTRPDGVPSGPADDIPVEFDFERGENRRLVVGAEDAGVRLDRFLAAHLRPLSRAAVQRVIRHEGAVLLNGAATRSSARLRTGDEIVVMIPEVRPPDVVPEDLPLSVLREEESFAVLDKGAAMAVHPGKGRRRGTIANAIAHRWGIVSTGHGAYRPGIVHRLDMDTTGVMVIAKNETAHARLAEAFKERRVQKVYCAIVFGDYPYDEDEIDLPLGRDVHDPRRRAVRFDGEGKAAKTAVRVIRRFQKSATLLECRPHTGRTHQIRVHLEQRGHPILGDTTYAARRTPPVPTPRLMLHAQRLTFPHPETDETVEVEAPLHADMDRVLAGLAGVEGGPGEGEE